MVVKQLGFALFGGGEDNADVVRYTLQEAQQTPYNPAGRTLRLARAGRIPFIQLPDDEVRFDEAVIERILHGKNAEQVK